MSRSINVCEHLLCVGRAMIADDQLKRGINTIWSLKDFQLLTPQNGMYWVQHHTFMVFLAQKQTLFCRTGVVYLGYWQLGRLWLAGHGPFVAGGADANNATARISQHTDWRRFLSRKCPAAFMLGR
jgi:hypothetical protein